MTHEPSASSARAQSTATAAAANPWWTLVAVAAHAYFGAYLVGQSHAFEVAAALGIVGVIISALRGADALARG